MSISEEDRYHIDTSVKDTSISKILLSHIPYIEEEIKKNHRKPPLIIFDIDDTLLDTSKISKKFPLFDGLYPTILFYNYVKNLGYHTLILTTRPESKRNITIENLNRLKVKNYDDIIFRTNDDISFAKHKFKNRKKLSEKYTIIANVGDQHSDFDGGYNGKIIIIPTFSTQ